jgi:hypothetical protein
VIVESISECGVQEEFRKQKKAVNGQALINADIYRCLQSDRQIRKAVVIEFGYSQKEIADFLERALFHNKQKSNRAVNARNKT